MTSTNIPKTDIKVIGFGNIFMSDDAIGIRVIQDLGSVPPEVEIIDGGTSAADLVSLARESRKIVVVDAVDAGQPMGEIIKFNLDEIDNFINHIKSYSLHDFGLSQALLLIKKLKISAEIIIIGIKPKNIEFGEKLSAEINEKLPEIKRLVLEEIND